MSNNIKKISRRNIRNTTTIIDITGVEFNNNEIVNSIKLSTESDNKVNDECKGFKNNEILRKNNDLFCMNSIKENYLNNNEKYNSNDINNELNLYHLNNKEKYILENIKNKSINDNLNLTLEKNSEFKSNIIKNRIMKYESSNLSNEINLKNKNSTVFKKKRSFDFQELLEIFKKIENDKDSSYNEDNENNKKQKISDSLDVKDLMKFPTINTNFFILKDKNLINQKKTNEITETKK